MEKWKALDEGHKLANRTGKYVLVVCEVSEPDLQEAFYPVVFDEWSEKHSKAMLCEGFYPTKQLYDAGYLEIKSAGLLAQVVEKTGAVVVDIRHSPRSRFPEWNAKKLQGLFGERYTRIAELGNKNYKGGPIEFENLDLGLYYLLKALQGNPVILLCSCKDRFYCHRSKIEIILRNRIEIRSIPLTLEKCQELIDLYP